MQLEEYTLPDIVWLKEAKEVGLPEKPHGQDTMFMGSILSLWEQGGRGLLVCKKNSSFKKESWLSSPPLARGTSCKYCNCQGKLTHLMVTKKEVVAFGF